MQRIKGFKKIPLLYFLIATVISAFAFFIVIYSTPYGVGYTPDSVSYSSSADILRNDNSLQRINSKGIIEDLSHFPPVFPAFLSLFTEHQQSVQILNAVLYASTSFVFFLIIYYQTQNPILSLVGQALISISSKVLLIHTYLWSEPFFLLVFSILLLLMLKYALTKKNAFYVGVVILTSFLPVIRYASLFILPIVVAFLFIIKSKSFIRSIVEGFLELLAMLAPYLMWMFYVGQTSSSIREISFHPIGIVKLKQMFVTISDWFISPTSSMPVRYLFISILVILAVIFLVVTLKDIVQDWRIDNKNYSMNAYWASCLAILGGYPIFLIISISFFDELTPMDNRILINLFLLIVMLLLSQYKRVLGLVKDQKILRLISILGYIFITLFIWKNIVENLEIRSKRLAYSSSEWLHSETLNGVRNLKMDVTILTNCYIPIYSHTQKQAIVIPTFELSLDDKSDTKSFLETFNDTEYYLVYFHRNCPGINRYDFNELIDYNHSYSYTDGEIYYHFQK
jgi:hypothetical protein